MVMKAVKANVISMKESTLREIIKEEIEGYMLELNPHHDSKTGRLSGPKKGNVYSLSKPAVRAAGWSPDKAKKGITTKKGKQQYKFGMADGDKACGRKTVSGKKIDPKRRCADYPNKYDEADHPLVPSSDDARSDRLDKIGFPKGLQALGRGVLRLDEEPGEDVFVSARDLVDVLNQLIVCHGEDDGGAQGQVVTEQFNAGLHKRCNENGYYTLTQAQQKILISLNAFALATDGKLNKTTS
jgi:hypothetical protein